MEHYSVPADFKTDTIDRYAQLHAEFPGSRICETYGNLTLGNPYGAGRVFARELNVDDEKLKEYIEYSDKNSIGFNYTLNSPSIQNRELTSTGMDMINAFLDRLHETGVRCITVSIPALIEIVKNHRGHFSVRSSILLEPENVNMARFIEGMGVDRVVLPLRIYRDFAKLSRIAESLHVPAEVIVNSVCYKDCIYNMYHHLKLSFDSICATSEYEYFDCRCYQRLLSNPGNFLRLQWIRPEDVGLYTNIGINHFKIQGRFTLLTGDPVRALRHYFHHSYDGDLMELLWLFSRHYKPTLKIDNAKLKKFLTPYAERNLVCSHDCSRCHYCDTFVESCTDASQICLFQNSVASPEFDKYTARIRSNLMPF